MKPLCLVLLFFTACSRHNNLLLGRVENTVGGHQVVVTDCYRTTVPEPKQIQGSEWRYTPCRDADIVIKGEELRVNGHAYGRLKPTDGVLVDHGEVSIVRN
jgi:hypothetical protein